MPLKELFGDGEEVRILDLIIPLSEKTAYLIEDVVHGAKVSPPDAEEILEMLVKRNLLLKSSGPVYRKNPNSNAAWAIENLIHSIYADRLRAESLSKIKQPEKKIKQPEKKNAPAKKK